MKGDTFATLFPKGLCFLCKKSCDPEAIVHYDCARSYDDYKRNKLRELEALDDIRKCRNSSFKGT